MGLTIHYCYQTPHASAQDAERLVRELHTHANTLGFEVVSELFHDTDPAADADTPNALIPGLRFVPKSRLSDAPATNVDVDAQDLANELRKEFEAECVAINANDWFELYPLEVWFFWANSLGAESLLIGLARYPTIIVRTIDGKPVPYETGLGDGWHWEGFCKPQFAGMPESGGPDNFIRTHLAIIALLDRVKKLGLHPKVTDEGGYWDHRDDQKLRADLRRWNAMIAGVSGRLRDKGLDTHSPIFSHPEFEHLEAEGDDAIRRWAEKARDDKKDRCGDPTT